MIKILQISTVNVEENGITNVIFNYIRAMNDPSIRIDLLAPNIPNAEYHQVVEKKGGVILSNSERNKSPIKYFFKLIKIAGQYDIVHIHGNSGTMFMELFASFIGGCKFRIAHCHNSACLHKFIHLIFRHGVNCLSTTRVACSDLAGDWMFNKKYSILYNAFDISKFAYSEEFRNKIRRELHLQDNELLIGHVGLFNNQKNQQFLIPVLKRLVDSGIPAKLLFVGKGPMYDDVKRTSQLASVEEKVIFYGVTDRIEEILSAMDVFVFPSIYEGLGVAAIEAQLNGLFCVLSSNVPSMTNITDNCVYIDVNNDDDVEQWYETIRKYECGQRTIIMNERIRNYDITLQSKRLAQIYQELISEKDKNH